MGMYNLGATTGAKESGKFLQPGIHNAKFLGIEMESGTAQNGRNWRAMKLNLDIENYGEFSHKFFEPDPNTGAQRTTGTYGENPSPAEHFLIAVRQILDALDPKLGEDIDNDTITVNGKHVKKDDWSFEQLVKLVIALTNPYKDTEVEVKLVPQSNNNFSDIPGFPAKITRNNQLGIQTRFIGHNLVMNQSEQKKIDAAKNAQPTNMAQTTSGSVEGLADALGIDANDIEDTQDLPF